MRDFPPFRLDPVNQCLWRRSSSGTDARILLSPSEYGVLNHLIERAGQLVTHRQLLDAVWPQTAIEPQAVKSKVFHLRRLLDDDPKQPRFIETIPRRGYRFVATVAAPVADQAMDQAPANGLVGRETELAALWAILRSATAGKPQVVFISGEAGIGKTALVEEFQRQICATRPTIRIARGQCVEGFGTKEQFYPMLNAVGQLCRGPSGNSIIDTLASHAPTWLVQYPGLLTREHRETLQQEILGATRQRMLREICEALDVITASVPVLLVFEDVQWLDSSTLDLISALARQPTAARIMLIATLQSTDVAHSAQPLYALKRDLVARHLCQELVLEPLAEREIGLFVSGGIAAVDAELVSLLQRHTEGNPLFIVAVLEHLAAGGLVERMGNTWHLRYPAAEISVTVPDSLRQLIGAQIERLDESEQRVLEVAAVAGASFAPSISAPTADTMPEVFEEICNTLVRRGQVLRLAGEQQLPNRQIVQRYAFVHALYREVLYERQTPARRAVLHRRRAERLEEVFTDDLDQVALEISHHAEKGGDWSRAVRCLRRAAEVAARRLRLEDARTNLQHALALTSRIAARERTTAEVEVLSPLAGIYLATLDPRVVETLTLLREKAAEHRLFDIEIEALVDLAYPLAWSGTQRSLEVIEQALSLSDAQQNPLARARTHARCVARRILVQGWNWQDAEELQHSMVEIRRLGKQEDVAWHLIDSGFVEVATSQYRQARSHAVDSLSLLREAHDDEIPLGYIAAHRLREYIVPWSLTFLGDWGAARREFDASIALADKNADEFGSGVLRLVKCWLQLFAADFSGARSTCTSILSKSEPPGRMFGRHLALTLSGASEAGLGNYDVALVQLQSARDEMDSHAALLDWNTRFWQRWALTNVCLSTGDHARGREEAKLFVANACATEERTWQGLAWETHARIALASHDLSGGQESIERALDSIRGFEVPVAAWQIHATAADVAAARGDEPSANSHRKASRETIHALVSSLERDDRLRQTFLAEPRVATSLSMA